MEQTLRDLREAQGLSQKKVAKRMNVSQGAVSFWENGKQRPCKKYWKQLAKLYGITVEELQVYLERSRHEGSSELSQLY